VLALAFDTWMTRFRPFTTFHLVMVAASALLIILACRHGRRLAAERPDAQRRFAIALGWSILAVQAFSTIWRLLPANYTLEDGLPLQLCRLAGWIAGFSLAFNWRWARTLTYFWGLGLCAQGFVTPLRLGGLGSMEFWFFWIVHLQIVGAAIYDLTVRRYRPLFSDWATAALFSMAYVAAIVPFNVFTGTEYGWLGRGNYRTRNIIDLLGPWPQRPILLVLIGQVVLVLLWLVWVPRNRAPASAAAPRAIAYETAVQPNPTGHPQPVEA
jgi:hypothetical integral membrane protein (TIGR02206 family)